MCTLVCSKLTELIIILLMLFYHPKQSSLTETGTLNVRGASEFIQKATQQNKLKHTKTEKKKPKWKQRCDKWKWRNMAGERVKGWHWWKNVYFTVIIIWFKRSVWDADKNGWQQRQPGVQKWKKHGDGGDRKSGCAAQERGEDAQPASGVKGIKI